MTYSEALREEFLKGRNEGLVKGMYEERENNVRSLLEVFPPEEVAAILNLPLPEIQAIADKK